MCWTLALRAITLPESGGQEPVVGLMSSDKHGQPTARWVCLHILWEVCQPASLRAVFEGTVSSYLLCLSLKPIRKGGKACHIVS